jgi:hypothetical protein
LLVAQATRDVREPQTLNPEPVEFGPLGPERPRVYTESVAVI